MALSKERYRALEAVVGPENISDDPVILYASAWRSGLAAGLQEFCPLFEAIILPGSTEEVQAVVKLCNKFKIQFKVASTNWGHFGDPPGPGCIQLDMRRMNKIIEINEENMYAVVESGLITAQLQAELMKRGLNCNSNGAGANTSAHPLVAHEGIGHMSQHASYNERNLLAAEWVTPDGEIVRTGSLGDLGEWFCGDGPGPSLRGVLRGNVTPLGGLGVYTKAALKLYHWPGPPVLPLEGYSPRYTPVPPLNNFLLRYYSFKDEDGRGLAIRKIGESEIGYVLMGFNVPMVAANIATNNGEEIELTEKYNREVIGPGFMIIIAGNSAKDFKYKEKVLMQIIAEAGGVSLKSIEDPSVADDFIWRCIRITGSIRETCRANGAFGGEVFGTDSYNIQSNFIQHSRKDKADLIEKGLIFADSIIPFVTSIEHGHFGHAEVLLRYRPNPETTEGIGAYMGISNEHALKGHYGLPHHVSGDALHDFFGPHISNYHLWLREIKRNVDPNGTAEASRYISAGE